MADAEPRRPRQIPLTAYTPWFNNCTLLGIVASVPTIHAWYRPARHAGEGPPVPHEAPPHSGLRNRSRFYGVHFLLFSRLRGIVAGKTYWKTLAVPVTHVTTSAKYAPFLKVGQPVLVKGELLRHRTKSGGWDSHVRCSAKPTLLWGRLGKHGVAEELQPMIDGSVIDGEDFVEDVLGERGDPIPYHEDF